MKKFFKVVVVVLVVFVCIFVFVDKNDKNEVFSSLIFKVMELRNIGFVYMFGCIVDIVVD